MTPLLQPFVGYLPSAEFAHRVVGPPISTLSPDQREAAQEDPLSFRHVVGRGAGTSPEEARAWLNTCIDDGVLAEVGPAVFVYRLAKGDLVATGLVTDVSVAAYAAGRVKRHEATLAKTEARMTEYMGEVRINGNPVALAHRPDPDVDASIAAHSQRHPDVSFVAADGYAHSLWVVEGAAAWELCAHFGDVLYITDGHHRLAAAARLAEAEGTPDLHIPAALFSSTELRIRAFARCVIDPDAELDAVRDRLAAEHRLVEVSTVEARPTDRHEYGVTLGSGSYRLSISDDRIPDDLLGRLDVNVLQEQVLGPLFGITDPRRDDRLHFVADLPHRSLEVDFDARFLPFPATAAEVMAVADAGLTMPPKSTWFAPKVPSGLVVRLMDP